MASTLESAIALAQAEIERLRAENATLRSDNEFMRVNHLNVLTNRAAILENERRAWNEDRFVIVFDINLLHQLNDKYGGQKPVDALMERAFNFRDDDLLFVFNKASGDEYGLVGRGDPARMMIRLAQSLADNDLSAVMVSEPLKQGDDLLAVCERGIQRVYAIKAQRNIQLR